MNREQEIEKLALDIYDKIEKYPDKGVSIRIARHLYEAGYRLPEQTGREAVARKLAMQDVKGRSDYADKTEEQVWENVMAESLDEEYLEDADQIRSLFPDEEAKKLIWEEGCRVGHNEAAKILENDERLAVKAERGRIQKGLELAIKTNNLKVNNGVLLWDIVQGQALGEK